jgi:SET domain-containing protein
LATLPDSDNVKNSMSSNGSQASAWHDAPEAADELTTDCLLVPHEIRRSNFGERGVYATESIPAGTHTVVFGGFVTQGRQFRQLPEHRQRHSLQIGEDLFLACGPTLNDGDFVNHSCDPNLGFVSEITLVALRHIGSGEELTFDYATCDSLPYDEFECECASPICRVKVTGEDWMLPALQQLRAGQFSPYLQRRIDALS